MTSNRQIISKSSLKKGGNIFGQKFWFNAVGKKGRISVMYYKIWLVILAVVIGVIYLGCTMYKGRHTTVLLNVAVTGGDSQKAEELNKDFCKYAGIDEKDGIIRIQANIPEDGGSLSSKTALTTLVGADAVDVLICREDVYQEYKKQDGFQETIDFPEDNVLKKKKIISYDDAHAAIMVNAQNQKMAEKFISYLEQLNHINNAN